MVPAGNQGVAEAHGIELSLQHMSEGPGRSPGPLLCESRRVSRRGILSHIDAALCARLTIHAEMIARPSGTTAGGFIANQPSIAARTLATGAAVSTNFDDFGLAPGICVGLCLLQKDVNPISIAFALGQGNRG